MTPVEKRVRRRLTAVVVVLFGSTLGWAGPRTKVVNEPYSAEFRTRVRKAIQAGVEFLRAEQMRGESAGPLFADLEYQGAAAVTWVLRRAGVANDDPALVAASTHLRSQPPKTAEETSLVLLSLCVVPLAAGDPFSTDTQEGTPAALSSDDESSMRSLVKSLLARQVNDDPTRKLMDFSSQGGWGSSDRADIGYATVPDTYLALIALEAAARRGADVPAKVYLEALQLLLGMQAAKGRAVSLRMSEVKGPERYEWTEKAQARGYSWSRPSNDTPSGFDTAAAAVGLIVCQDALQKEAQFTPELRARTKKAIRDAIAWVQQNYDVSKNPVTGDYKLFRSSVPRLYHHNWLQSLCRLALHARMRFIGKHDWYAEGAEYLLKSQGLNGGWGGLWWENCYPLLFLQRASLASVAPAVTEGE